MTDKTDNETPNAAAKNAAKVKEETAKPVKKPPFYVAKGKSVICKNGIHEYPDEITVELLGGGDESLKRLITVGSVIKS